MTGDSAPYRHLQRVLSWEIFFQNFSSSSGSTEEMCTDLGPDKPIWDTWLGSPLGSLLSQGKGEDGLHQPSA